MGFYGGQETVAPQEFDNLYSKSGAQPLRKQIFDTLPGNIDAGNKAGAQAAEAARVGAAGFAPIQNYGNELLGGKYLNYNPYLEHGLQTTRAATEGALHQGNAAADTIAHNAISGARADQAGQDAATRAQFARSGMAFSTAGGQAQDATHAALAAQLARGEQNRSAQQDATGAGVQAQLAQQENTARAGSFAQERQLQSQAPGILSNALQMPVNLLQAIPGLMNAGSDSAMNLIRGLATGSQVVNPNTYYKPGVGDYAMQGIGALGSMASL